MLHAFPGINGRQRGLLSRNSSSLIYVEVTVTAGGTIGTYGAAWTTVIASTPFEVTMIRVTNTTTISNSGARGDAVATVAKGASTAETQIIGPLIFGGRQVLSSYTLPCRIPANTRLSMKTAAGVASRAMNFSIELFGSPNRHDTSLPTSWVAYGMTVTSGTGAYGTLHTAGSTNTWSAWTDLGTTTKPHDLWLPMAGIGNVTALAALNWRTQFAIASTTDAATMVTNSTGVVDGPDFSGSTSEQMGKFPTATFPHVITPVDILYAPRPSGSSMSVRSLCSGAPTAGALSVAMLAAVK